MAQMVYFFNSCVPVKCRNGQILLRLKTLQILIWKPIKKVNAKVSHGAVNMQLLDMRVMLERLTSNPSLFNDLDGGLGCGAAQFEFFFTWNFLHDYYRSERSEWSKQMIDKIQITTCKCCFGCEQYRSRYLVRRIASGNVMYCNMKGFTLRNGALCKFHLPGLSTWLKQQVCTETVELLPVRNQTFLEA